MNVRGQSFITVYILFFSKTNYVALFDKTSLLQMFEFYSKVVTLESQLCAPGTFGAPGVIQSQDGFLLLLLFLP